MLIFLIIFFLIYGLFHFYAFLKVCAAFDLQGKKIALVLFMVCMTAAPVLVRLLERGGYEALARFLSVTGYVWMGLLFLFVSFALVVDAARFLIFLLTRINRDGGRLRINAKAACLFPLAAACCLALYGFYEAGNIHTERIVLSSPKIPASVGTLRIVQISDVHLGLMVRKKRLRKIVAAIKKGSPDILVSTGDLVDGQTNSLAGLAEMLRSVKPRYGKFAVTGNHEFYAGLQQALDFTRQAGFTLLRGEGVVVGEAINLAGVDDRTGVMLGRSRPVSEKTMLQKLPQNKFTVLLKHRPDVSGESLGLFDLQLSGHTHKGQIFPFNLLTWAFYPVHAGILNPVDGCYLYVSRGSGTWGPPFRVFSPPEVTIIELVHRPPAAGGEEEMGSGAAFIPHLPAVDDHKHLEEAL